MPGQISGPNSCRAGLEAAAEALTSTHDPGPDLFPRALLPGSAPSYLAVQSCLYLCLAFSFPALSSLTAFWGDAGQA